MHGHFGERPSHVRTFEMIETKALRRRMEAAIETLIATLDALDGDADLEAANDDEPTLGWPGVGQGAAARLDGPPRDGGDDDRELDDSDYEPSLGAPERHPSGDRGWRPLLRRDDDGRQSAWAAGGDSGEREECCEDEGDDSGDRESDPAEWGIADFDGVAEQFGRGGWSGEGAI